jgi:hypothetical protein
MRVESSPTNEQKERLEDFLSELALITRKYRIYLQSCHESLLLIDAERDTVLGVDLTLWLKQGLFVGYDVEDSILDGIWMIDTPEGPQEQRVVGTVWPRREERTGT